jgi:hypothetical protein
MMTRDRALEEISKVETAAFVLASAMSLETRLADERALKKDDAIARLRQANIATSVTAAEKIVERDEEFMAHRIAEREAVAERIVAEGKLAASKFRAQLAVEMAAIDEQAREADYEIVDPMDTHVGHLVEKVDRMLDDAGVPQKPLESAPHGPFLGIDERVRLLIAERNALKVAELSEARK